jgi:hypothetical protein
MTIQTKPKRSKINHDQERKRLLSFASAIDCRRANLKRDDCGYWSLQGKAGHVYSVPLGEGHGFQIMIIGYGLAGRWNNAKRALSFATLTQNGDEEGGFILDRLPAPAEAKTIRHYVGLPQARHLSDVNRTKAIARLKVHAQPKGQAEAQDWQIGACR